MRFWVGIVLPNKTCKKLFRIEKEISEKYKTYYSLKSRIGLHLTLTYQGNIKEGNLEKIEKAVNEISETTKSFEVEIKGIRRFCKNRFIYAKIIKSKELNDLYKKLFCRLSEFGKIRPLRIFKPHITLAYKDITEENFNEAFKEFKDKKISYEFKVNKLYLAKSNPEERLKLFKSFNLK